jgi:hypothetical protein
MHNIAQKVIASVMGLEVSKMKSDVKPAMTARISATVPDYVANGIKQLAMQQGREPSSMAAFIIEQAVIKEIEVGKIPSEQSLQPEITNKIRLIAKKQGVDVIEAMSFLLNKAIEEELGEEISSAQ